MKRKALGRGLSALLSDAPVGPAEMNKKVEDIPLFLIEANKMQPRKHFNEDALFELSESIRSQGILQPLLVRALPDNADGYQVLAGERRLRAARMAELPCAPCIVLDADETQVMEIALVENIQRSDLTPVEEAHAFKYLADRFALTQEEISKKVGKSRESIANSLRILQLPPDILAALDCGLLSAGHAKVMLSLKESPFLQTIFQRVVEESLSVRETERVVREITNPSPKSADSAVKAPPKEENVHIAALQKSLETTFQTKVNVKMKGKKKGSIEIQFYDLDQLDTLLSLWKVRV